MNKKDIENLNEAYDHINDAYVPTDPKAGRAMNAPGANAKFMGASITPTKLSPTAGDAHAWIKMFKDEGFIEHRRPLTPNMEEAIAIDIDKPITELDLGDVYHITSRNGIPGIKIIFRDGGAVSLFGFDNKHMNKTLGQKGKKKLPSVSEVLAATWRTYPDAFEKIADTLIGRAGYYE